MNMLDLAPRRFDGTLARVRWPEGHPMAYALKGGREVCGACATKALAQDADFDGFGVLDHAYAFRCGGCGHAVFRRADDFARFPLPGMPRRAAGDEEMVTIVFQGGRFLPRTEAESEDAADPEHTALGPEVREAMGRHQQHLPLTAEQRSMLLEKGLITDGRENSAYVIVNSDLGFELFKSIPKGGIDRAHPYYELVIDALDLLLALRSAVGHGRRLWEGKKLEEAAKYLRGFRTRHPGHFAGWALLALILEKLGKDREARWEWEGLGDAFAAASLPAAAASAQKGWVIFG